MTTSQTIDRADRAPAPTIEFEPAKLRRRYDGWSAEKQIRFIEALAATKCVDQACRIVGMSDTSAYMLRNRPCGQHFARAWDIALDCQIADLEQRAIDRARFGVPRPIFYKGEQVGEYRHFDERLTMFLLRSRRAERYGRALEQPAQPAAPQPVFDPDEVDEEPMTLDDALEIINISGPGEHGNPADDWHEGIDVEIDAPPAPARVGQQTWQTSAPGGHIADT